jgi:hypothetical protein
MEERIPQARSEVAPALRAFAVQALLALVIYAPTGQLAFVSDAWVYIEQLHRGLRTAVASPIGYHWQPVACAWVGVLRAVLGERPALFQAANVAQLLMVAQLTYWLGRRTLGAAGDALLASVLLVGSATFYEATYWPLAGNMHSIAAVSWLLCLLVAERVARGWLGALGPWLLAFVALLATFSHPAMVTTVPVAVFVQVVVGRRERVATALLAKRCAPLVFVVVAFLAARRAFDAAVALGPQPGFDLVRVYYLVSRGLLGVFTLRGSQEPLHRLLTWGAEVPVGTQVRAYVVAWLAMAVVAGALWFWRARDVGTRILLGALAIHLGALTLAGGVSSRQCIVPAALAALLTIRALRGAMDLVPVRVGGGEALASMARELPALTVLVLVVGAARDHAVALRVHVQSAEASRAIVESLRAHASGRGPYELTLLNVPAYYYEHGIGALAFGNGGIVELARVVTPGVTRVDLRQMPTANAPDAVIPGLLTAGPDTLREQVADPRRVVLVFEKEPYGMRSLTAADLDRSTMR